jgi:hypothetical protein
MRRGIAVLCASVWLSLGPMPGTRPGGNPGIVGNSP